MSTTPEMIKEFTRIKIPVRKNKVNQSKSLAIAIFSDFSNTYQIIAINAQKIQIIASEEWNGRNGSIARWIVIKQNKIVGTQVLTFVGVCEYSHG